MTTTLTRRTALAAIAAVPAVAPLGALPSVPMYKLPAEYDDWLALRITTAT